MGLQDQLLTLLLNSKKGDELPVISDLSNTGKIIVYDPDTELVSTILKENLVVSSSSGGIYPIPVTVDNNNQSEYAIEGKPDGVLVNIGRVPQRLNEDFSYNNQTGVLTILKASLIASITTNTIIDVWGYSFGTAKPESLIISSNNQSTYTLLDNPKYVKPVLNRVSLSIGDFTYDNTTGQMVITNTKFTDTITPNSNLEVLKIY